MTLIEIISAQITTIALALTIFLLGIIVGRFVGKLTTQILIEVGLQEVLEKLGIEIRISNYVGTVLSFGIYVLSVILALNKLSLTKFVTIILVLIASILTTLSLTFGLQDWIKNLFTGFGIRKNYPKNKKVRMKRVTGNVIKNLATKIIVKTKHDTLVIPYTALLENEDKE